jgi:cysteine synthase A
MAISVDGKLNIGNTPLLRLEKSRKVFSLGANVYAKIESANAGGSIEDRVALEILLDAEERGVISAGGTVVEATSGNTGIGLALVCKAKGYKAIIVMPDTMSKERQDAMRAFGAEVLLTDGAKGMQGAVELAERICKNTPNSMLAAQFENPANPAAHYKTTAPEIYEELQGKVDIFVACVGTGGTLTGVGRYLKEKNPSVKVVAVEPKKSPLLSGGVAGAHAIQGIGANFIPNVLDRTVYDEVICVDDEAAFATARWLYKTENVFVGISSGAAAHAAFSLAKRPENANKNIVTVFPDGGERYLSTGLFD